MKCPKCGAELNSNAKFCIECGAQINNLHVCKQCGNELPEGAKFCMNCGAKVELESELDQMYLGNDTETDNDTLQLEDLYKRLITDRPSSFSTAEDFYKSTADIFELVGLEDFKTPDEDDLERIKNLSDNLCNKAEKLWLRIDEAKVDNFKQAIGALNAFFRYYDQKKYGDAIEDYLFNNLKLVIDDKADDKIIDIVELTRIMDTAKKLKLWNDRNGRKEKILSKVEHYSNSIGCTIENYQDMFIREISQYPSEKLLDSEENRKELLSEFSKLYDCHVALYGGYIPNLKEEMNYVLSQHGIHLSSKINAFETEYFNKVAQNEKPISNDKILEMKFVANREYKFTDEEWDQFAKQHNLTLQLNNTGNSSPAAKPKEVKLGNEFVRIEGSGRIKNFNLAKYEVTQKLYEEIMGVNPSNSIGPDKPVEKVTWYEAIEFCNKLSEKEGRTCCYKINGKNTIYNRNANGYRIPTEEEWEYAAKSGRFNDSLTYAGSDSIGDVAWWKENSDGDSHPVGLKKPNKLGLYDMSGNVWEWCWDSAFNGARYFVGGSWATDKKGCAIGHDESCSAEDKSRILGFRIAFTEI